MHASMVEWSNTTRCKRVAFGLRGFESLSTHKIKKTRFLLSFFNLCLVVSKRTASLAWGIRTTEYKFSVENFMSRCPDKVLRR